MSRASFLFQGRSARPRLKLFQNLAKVRHRYEMGRALTQTVSICILFAVPMTGLAQVDFATGRHRLFFEQATLRPALAGVIVGIAAMYVVTFLSNIAAGRLFCGWGCPVGQVSRFGEMVDRPRNTRRQRFGHALRGALFSLVFVASILAWWVNLDVLWRPLGRTTAIVWALLLAGVAATYLHGRGWRWNFCKSVCPIGLYYSFVSPAGWFGIHFRNDQATCLDCDLCDHVCPVDLHPRDLMAPVPARAGISIADAPGRNHCLECGDCVRACEWIIDLRGRQPVPLRLGYYEKPQRVGGPLDADLAADLAAAPAADEPVVAVAS